MNELREKLKFRDINIHHYYPSVIAGAPEFRETAATMEAKLNALLDLLKNRTLDTFVYDLDEYGARRWENMLNIIPEKGATLDDRRGVILSKINTFLPYTDRRFQQMLNGRFEEGTVKASYDYNAYTLYLDILSYFLGDSNKVRTFARAIVPANLSIRITNTKKLNSKVFTGGKVRVPTITHIMANTKVKAPTINNGMVTAGAVGMAKKIIHIR